MDRRGDTVHTPRRLDDAALTALRASLNEHRRFRLDQLRDITQSAATTPDSEQVPPPRSAALDEIRQQLAAAAHVALTETDAALARMDSGSYGKCQRCGTDIDLQRLYAHPQARYCIRCHHAEDSHQ
jgi:RNA polymerase-binding transcription factor DksA